MQCITKKQAVELFGSQKGVADAVGLTPSRISQWPDLLAQKQSDLVMGAALRLGVLERKSA